MRCMTCGRELTSLRSMIRRHGETCWANHLAELPDEEREAARMTGYKVKQIGPAVYVVTSPEANAYMVSLDPEIKCDCPHWSRHGDCKHVALVMRHRGEVEPVRRRSDAEIMRDIALDFGD